ncbi:MAG: trigger factor [Lentimicrobium sp.]|jgi:trigger factor|nr:trigger factor [Lentimicrobium sp.]MDD2527114.1 trigger factor [Lentimicrobiaceae bacterium]MDD4597869.1 trigger factor [Lentimicrobiaceae bacterium]MDY0025045.1 trigger factor [Lentimicrobium sp.]
MNIELQQKEEQLASLKLDIAPEDYQEKVTQKLKEYQRKASMPGFRPGKVPFSLTRKMYGPAVKAEIINNLIDESVNNYIRENNLNILGQPIPGADEVQAQDWQQDEAMTFTFDLGLAPEFEVNLENLKDINYYQLEITDEVAEKYLEDARTREANWKETGQSVKGDMIKGRIIDPEPELEVEIETARFDEDEVLIKPFIGVSKGDEITIEASEKLTAERVAEMLLLKDEEVQPYLNGFKILVDSVMHKEPATLDEDFFDKMYPGESITNKEDLIARIKKDASQSLQRESDQQFFNDTIGALIEQTNISLPDSFLKRWLIEVNQEKMTPEFVEENYADYARSMRWQMIENRLIRDNNIGVETDEVKNVFRSYFQRPGSTEPDEETLQRIDSVVESFMKNEEEVRRISDQIFNTKLVSLFKEKVKPIEKPLTQEEFAKLREEKK